MIPKIPKTLKFLGTPSNLKDASICISDVHGLYGGINMILRGTGKILVQKIEYIGGVLIEKRFVFYIGLKKVKDIFNFLIDKDIVGLKTEKRAGIPDESQRRIIIFNPEGEKFEIFKWMYSKNNKFDDIYLRLINIATKLRDKDMDLEQKWNGELIQKIDL